MSNNTLQKEFTRFLLGINVIGQRNASFRKIKVEHLLKNLESPSSKQVQNQTSTLKKHSSLLLGNTPLYKKIDSRDIKKKLIDSAATTSGTNTNVNLDNKGQGKSGCCS